MGVASPVYHLFGFISMTPVLWIFFLAQTVLVLVALRLCFVPIKNARRGQRLMLANGLAIPLTFVISAASYVAGMIESFGASAEASESDKARILATGISTMMNVMWLWIPFAIIVGVLLGVQIARHREAASVKFDQR
ncbi:MAG TPA: hypothetical protein VFK05_05755 [Polyangiaceae bacterium]|nr:hypothetical protein [Polyangiaceae bacterium]